MIKQLSIHGFRGFGIKQEISFAIPDGKTPGSGLSIITGANNSGKTTIIESIRTFNGFEPPSFSEGKRNINTNGKVKLGIVDENNNEFCIESLEEGSQSIKNKDSLHKYYIVQSRRSASFEFYKSESTRDSHISKSMQFEQEREYVLKNFNDRLFEIEKDKSEFNKILNRILGHDFEWDIELRDNGMYYIKYKQKGISHSSEGLGDGIWSIFTICAALFDAGEGSVTVIDEPELSIHPALQKKLMNLFIEYSSTRQIILCTHSPYFINWNAINVGAQLIRVVKEDTNTICYTISDESKTRMKKLLNDMHNPHILGINANEIFFLEDNIILVEGQEDVVIFNKIAKELEKEIKGNFFGWGVGGAPKMEMFLNLFEDLGYKKVVAIFDGDKATDAEEAKKIFPGFKIIKLIKDDIRDKEARNIGTKEGLTNIGGKLKPENKDYANDLIDEINACFI